MTKNDAETETVGKLSAKKNYNVQCTSHKKFLFNSKTNSSPLKERKKEDDE